MSRPVRRSPTTWALLLLTATVTALVSLSAVASLSVAAGLRTVDATARARAGELGVFGDADLRVMEGWAALVTVPAAAVALLVLLGLVTWRPWAREATLGVFGLVGSLICLFSLVSLAGPADSGGQGLAFGLALVAAAALAVSAPVCEDFDRWRIAGEVEERRRRQEQRRRSGAS